MALLTLHDQGKQGRRGDTEFQKQKHSVTGETKWLVPYTFVQAPEGRAQALVSSQYTVGNTQPSQRGQVAKEECGGGGGAFPEQGGQRGQSCQRRQVTAAFIKAWTFRNMLWRSHMMLEWSQTLLRAEDSPNPAFLVYCQLPEGTQQIVVE